MTKPICIDLGCGRGGWARGFLKRGFRVVGFDIQAFSEYPGDLVLQDLTTLSGAQFRGVACIVASPPCAEFTVHAMKMFHKKPPPPTNGIWLFRECERICKESGALYVIENVWAAQQFVGPAVARCGPFYLWGNAVPALFSEKEYNLKKHLLNYKGVRANRASIVAMIPEALSDAVAKAMQAERVAL